MPTCRGGNPGFGLPCKPLEDSQALGLLALLAQPVSLHATSLALFSLPPYHDFPKGEVTSRVGLPCGTPLI